MSSMPNGSRTDFAWSAEGFSSPFGRGNADILLELGDTIRRTTPDRPRRAPKPFERLLGALSLADLNDYRAAAGREPDLDAMALYALHDAADRFFPVRNDETGGRYLRNAYLKYLSEHVDLVDILHGADEEAWPFGMSAAA
ncbi:MULTISPECIES: hypothetical protein [unclassified Aureimonas]|uniref:hypothetical protein n=1 Tax=unclassified Aureimonas TaxID=2615206 RepID=UPI0006FAF569|nr:MULTISPECIES: hypothetical protein [unclassified Aureimonas]KQT64273.1 hypothetical protein ASG62_04585 [Aureimonas sp. Leaf427]KQT81462.1 hypothetical protein ASG54_01850 [Aureimonas sp. Leaf460]